MGVLQTVEFRNFKAFPHLTLDLNGRHLLVYGANGSGKSSLYWGLHMFLESVGKSQIELQKYFDPNHIESLVNLDADPLDTTAGSIKLTTGEPGGMPNVYEISYAQHQTANQPDISKASLASDFISYRFFFNFSNFTNGESFEIWPLFEREILPFCVTTSNENLLSSWSAICTRHADSLARKSRGVAARNDREFLEHNTSAFATDLNATVEAIAAEAKDFYAKHFTKDGDIPMELHLKLGTPPTYIHEGRRLGVPKILFGITKSGANPRNIERPQTFLNEAKLTQIAISIRLAASLVNLNQSSLKLLVLDDLLVSLDMSNRMKVVEIILSDKFADYQKIILTHDLGFFQETRRQIGPAHSDWSFRKFDESTPGVYRLVKVKSDLEVAQDYLANDQLAECGNRLRKYAEANLEHFLNAARSKRRVESSPN